MAQQAIRNRGASRLLEPERQHFPLEEQLAPLTEQQLEELKQEIIKQRGQEGEESVAQAIGKGVGRGATAFGEGALRGLQGRDLSGVGEGDKASDLETFEQKERIKRKIKAEFDDEVETFGDASKKAVDGELTFDELRKMFPLKRDKIDDLEESIGIDKQRAEPAVVDPSFKEGTGGLISRVGSLFSKKQAEITPKTQSVIEQIETQEDIDDLIAREAEAKEQGIDIDAIYEFYGLTKSMVLRRKEELKEGLR